MWISESDRHTQQMQRHKKVSIIDIPDEVILLSRVDDCSLFSVSGGPFYTLHDAVGTAAPPTE